MALKLPTTVRDSRVQQCLDFLSRQFPISTGNLADAVRELFPQLVEPASRKVNFGSVEVEWPGGNRASNAKTITHGLGVSPKSISGVASGFAGVYVEVKAAGATTFEIRGTVSEGLPGAGVKVLVYWQAIG